MSFRDGFMAGLSGLRPPVVTRTTCVSEEWRSADLPQGAADYYLRAYRGAMAQIAELRRQLAAMRQASTRAPAEDAAQCQLIENLRRENSELRASEQRALNRVAELEAQLSHGTPEAFRLRVINSARIALHPDRWGGKPNVAAFAEERFREIQERVAQVPVG